VQEVEMMEGYCECMAEKIEECDRLRAQRDKEREENAKLREQLNKLGIKI
jgi:hypothetical protein